MKSVILLNTPIEKELEILGRESRVLIGELWESSAGKGKEKITVCVKCCESERLGVFGGFIIVLFLVLF